jgi:hypothetical protein
MLAVGALDRITVILGERGTGKSTLAWLDARGFRAETGGYMIGHSPNGQIGARDDVAFYDDIGKLGRGLRRHPEKQHYLTKGTAESVIAYGDALSTAIRKRAFKRAFPLKVWREDRPAPDGLMAPPVLITIDEGVAMHRHPTNEESERLERFLTSARHKHVAFTWLSQAPTARQWIILEQANRLRIFRYVHEWGGNAIRAAGIDREVIAVLRELPDFTYYHHDKKAPQAAYFTSLPPPGHR